MAPSDDDQQFCLRWNNFQKNITSQFEALRDDEDFVDVTLACDQRTFGAHKVVLSACSPFFKQLFKRNPCSHPIIFMRDVAAKDVEALLEFMYAGEVNVAQANLAGFLRTAESLQIRGLTETTKNPKESTTESIKQTTPEDTKRPASQNVHEPAKKVCKIENDTSKTQYDITEPPHYSEKLPELDMMEPKVEPDYESDNGLDKSMDESMMGFDVNESGNIFGSVPGAADSLAGGSTVDLTQDSNQGIIPSRRSAKIKRRFSIDDAWVPLALDMSSSRLVDETSHLDSITPRFCPNDHSLHRGGVVKIGEGIEICEEQLKGVKWSDYRKLTRGLATVLFSPMELATCSVTGQRWSRAGTGERPVKPALDRTKVQAIISYVATRFPNVEVSRIKQVLAYKCKENSTAFKMKTIRYFGDQMRAADDSY